MNRFVIDVPVEVNEYLVIIPFPLETECSRMDLVEEMQTFYDSVTELGQGGNVLDLGGSGIMVEDYKIRGWGDEFAPLTIRTVDEWFAAYGWERICV